MEDKIITLRTGKKGKLKPGHPWIFKGQTLKTPPGIRPGDIVTIVNGRGEFTGRGYYNPASEITIRLFTFDDEPIDGAFLRNRIESAIAKRDFLSGLTNAARLVFSEADGLPGLIVDRYNETIVFQVFTLGIERMKEGLIKILADIVNPKYIYEKSDSPFRKKEGLKTIKKWWLYEGKTDIEIYEGDAKFIVDIDNGHKTGFYLDQRRSRLALKDISTGKSVLDLFCYTGGFSINAALGLAKRVVGVDIKQKWLSLARKNAEINGVSDVIEHREGDVFKILKDICDSGEKFDIIVLDPPSFAKDKRSIITAAKGYKELNTLAMRALIDGGVLCTFSCSHSMSNEIFSDMIKASASQARKSLMILKRCHQDKDHPIVRSIPQTEYLKGRFLKVNSI
ncbi:MAG: class I SAM-dependent rRNA methyltransferase [Candidatus Omnitrophica bacterium]|nr:class I SAM-dependent rRNA methyltransferase [Candidatus Omnitrophota bacterium]